MREAGCGNTFGNAQQNHEFRYSDLLSSKRAQHEDRVEEQQR